MTSILEMTPKGTFKDGFNFAIMNHKWAITKVICPFCEDTKDKRMCHRIDTTEGMLGRVVLCSECGAALFLVFQPLLGFVRPVLGYWKINREVGEQNGIKSEGAGRNEAIQG
jgi:hypothetical protein